MTTKFVTARNTLSGVVGIVPASYMEHPVFSTQLVLVEDGAKDYNPALYTPKTADEFNADLSDNKAEAAKPAAKATDIKDEEK